MDWNLYSANLHVQGETRRDRVIAQTQRIINSRITNSAAYKQVLIDGCPQCLSIRSGSELYHKKIAAMPNERIHVGSIVYWNERYFLITASDVEDEIYQSGEMFQCNIYLKWQNEKGEIIGRYGYSEVKSQFTDGITEGNAMMKIVQTVNIKLPLDSETVKLRRDKRFLIDVVTEKPSAYILTNRNVTSYNFTPANINNTAEAFNGQDKLLVLTLSQTQLSEKDNCELMIADYIDNTNSGSSSNGSCFIIYSGQPVVKVGGSDKKFTAEFKDSNGKILNIKPVWNVTVMPEFQKKFKITKDENWIKISAVNDLNLLGTQILLQVTDENCIYNSKIYIKVVSLYG